MSTVQKSEVPSRASRVLIAPNQRLPNDFVLIRVGEMPQKSLASLFENERHKASAFRAHPGVQLNHILAVVDAPLKGWQIPQSFHRTNNAYRQQPCRAVRLGNYVQPGFPCNSEELLF
jgi:hypothetical protein